MEGAYMALDTIIAQHLTVYLHNNPMTQGSAIILSLQMGSRGIGRLGHLPKLTQEVCGRAGTGSLVFGVVG